MTTYKATVVVADAPQTLAAGLFNALWVSGVPNIALANNTANCGVYDQEAGTGPVLVGNDQQTEGVLGQALMDQLTGDFPGWLFSGVTGDGDGGTFTAPTVPTIVFAYSSYPNGALFYNSSGQTTYIEPPANVSFAPPDGFAATIDSTGSDAQYSTIGAYVWIANLALQSDALGAQGLSLLTAFTYQNNGDPTHPPSFDYTFAETSVGGNVVTNGFFFGGDYSVVSRPDRVDIVWWGTAITNVVTAGAPLLTISITNEGDISVFANGNTGQDWNVPGLILADDAGIGVGYQSGDVITYNPGANPAIVDTGNPISDLGLGGSAVFGAVGNGNAFYVSTLDETLFVSAIYYSANGMGSFEALALTSAGDSTIAFLESGEFYAPLMWMESGVLFALVTQILPGPSFGSSFIVSMEEYSAPPFQVYPKPPILPASCVDLCGGLD